MPIHEYRCQDCGATSEFLVGVSAELENQVYVCSRCQSANLKRLMSAINIGKIQAAPGCESVGDCGIPGSGRGCCGGACSGHN